MFERLAVVGCGLMGGSFALAMKQRGLVQHVVGYSRSSTTLELGLHLGVIDTAATSAAQAVANADLVLLAVPVAATAATLKSIRETLAPGALLMDVGSTKRDVVDAARRVLRERVTSFVPAHPIAGKESAGVQHADAALYQRCNVILTPLPQTQADLVKKAAELWTALGGRVSCLTPERHDAAFAAVSHFPHLLAFAFFNAVASEPEGKENLALAGPGFRDFTRIAASDPAIWRDILSANREEVLKQSQRFRQALEAFETALLNDNGDAVEALIRCAAEGRSHWHMGGGRSPSGTRG